jgi:cobalt-zinc-cadmium resistance protein CzcA
VSVLGDMVLVSTVRQRLAAGEALATAVEGAALDRLRPVLMTALGGLLRLLADGPQHRLRAEVQRPLATVVVGGVVSSTLLTLLVLPVLYSVVGARQTRRPNAATASGRGPSPSLVPERDADRA